MQNSLQDMFSPGPVQDMFSPGSVNQKLS